MTWQDSVWNTLAATSYYAALIPIVFGGLNYFKGWLPSEDDIRKRCGTHREILNEKINKCLFRIIDNFQRSLQASDLRGAPPKEPDVIADYTAEVFRVFYVHAALMATECTLRRTHTFLLTTAIIGVLCLGVAMPFETLRPFVAMFALAVFAAQAISVLCVRSSLKKLSGYESGT